MNRLAIRSAVRHLKKNLRFSIFNVFGLTLGFLSFFFISLYVNDELKYDSFNLNKENIFRIESHLKLGDEVSDYATAPPIVGASISSALPDIEKSCRLFAEKGSRFELNNEFIAEDNIIYADQSVFDVFTFHFLKGTAQSAFSENSNIVLSENAAKKYFNSTSVIGKLIRLQKDDSLYSFTITGVIENIPVQSHFKADFLIPIDNNAVSTNNNFLSFYPFSTYIVKKKSADAKVLETKINNWIHASIPDYESIEKGGNKIAVVLTPLLDIHFKSDKKYELGRNGNVQYVYIFSAAAIFILCMAGINFMNLSLARFTKRSREVAVKKVLGSSTSLLSKQFLVESIILCLVATIISLLLGWCLMTYFNEISNKSITFADILKSWTIPFLLGISLLLGALSGAYPAVVLSSLNATAILSGKSFVNNNRSLFSLRNFLLVTQFVVSTFLITGTIIIYKQLTFIHEKDNGYNKAQLLVVRNASALTNPSLLKQSALNIPGVESATLSGYLPTNNARWSNFGGSSSANPIQSEFWPVDEDYLSTLGIEIKRGRNFDKLRTTDSTAVILNESAYRAFGLGEKIWSQPVTFSYRQQQKGYHVIGVVKDFHFNSLRQNITPLVFVLSDNNKASLIIKCANAEDVFSMLSASWNALAPKEKMDVSFMDDDFNAIYRDDTLMGQLFLIFASLSIVIACLGLFGLINYSIGVRKKELAIRKTLGASQVSVVSLLSKQYVLLVLCAIIIATPLTWVLKSQWLQQFAYRYEIGYFEYVIAGLLSVVIAILTLSSRVMTINRRKLLENLKSS